MRRWLVPASFLIALCPTTAALADGGCPPGSWFCEETPVTAPPANDEGPDDSTATTPQDAPAPKKKHKKQQQPTETQAGGTTQVQTSGGVEIQAQGPIVIYTQNGQQVVTNGQPAAPAAPVAPPRKPPVKKKWREHFGLNLRAEGAGFAAANGDTAGMGGLGLSFRWRPAPAFALDVGLDILGGNDYYQEERIESALSLSGMVFFNPKSMFQIYALGGFHVSHAEISNNYYPLGDSSSFYTPQSSRDYIGVHGGLGLELRIAKHVGLDLDGVAILRTGLGNGSDEFVDTKSGQSTDTSGAGMARAGVTFWW